MVLLKGVHFQIQWHYSTFVHFLCVRLVNETNKTLIMKLLTVDVQIFVGTKIKNKTHENETHRAP